MATGRGAWTTIGGTTPFYELHDPNVGSQSSKDSSLDPNAFDFRAVKYGVIAYQWRINDFDYIPRLDEDGWLGPATAEGIKWVQKHLNMTSGYTPGRIGMDLAKAIFKPVIEAIEKEFAIPAHLLGGLVGAESSFDAGAVGYLTPWDKGLLQFNCDPATNPRTWWNIDSKPYTVANAFDHTWALREGAKRLQWAKGRYSGKGSTLQIQCMAAQHNAPAWADQWFHNGYAPNDTIKKYVGNVLTNAQNW